MNKPTETKKEKKKSFWLSVLKTVGQVLVSIFTKKP